jgi:hypothetical protein
MGCGIVGRVREEGASKITNNSIYDIVTKGKEEDKNGKNEEKRPGRSRAALA